MSKSNNNNNFVAFAFILLGAFFFLKVLNVPFINHFNLGYFIGILWPLFLIVPGINMLKRGVDLGGVILTVIGGSFLLDNLLSIYNIDFKATSIFKFFWPALFIFIGFKMLSKPSKSYGKGQRVVFGSAEEENCTSKSDSISFGSKTYTFKKDTMAHGITKLNLNISFGGAEIHVEEGIQVILLGQYTFGGHEFFGKDAGGLHSGIKESRYVENDDTFYDQTLIIDARLSFAGLEIRHR